MLPPAEPADRRGRWSPTHFDATTVRDLATVREEVADGGPTRGRRGFRGGSGRSLEGGGVRLPAARLHRPGERDGRDDFVQDIHPEDVYWCTADIGWITGHSDVVYGPLALAATPSRVAPDGSGHRAEAMRGRETRQEAYHGNSTNRIPRARPGVIPGR